MMSFITFNNDAKNATASEQISMIIDMVVDNGNYNNMTAASYNASFGIAAKASLPLSRINPLVNSPAYRLRSFRFCKDSCALFTANIFGDEVLDKSITPFMHVLTGGSCGDVYTIPAAESVNLQEEPTPFVESYFVCTSSEDDAVVEAVGVASGTAGTFVPLIITIALLIVRKWLHLQGYMLSSPEYDPTDIQTKRREFFECLLTCRGMDPERGDHHLVSRLSPQQRKSGFHAIGDDLWAHERVINKLSQTSSFHELGATAETTNVTAKIAAPELAYLSDSESSTASDGHNETRSGAESPPIALYDELSFDSDLLESNDDASNDGIDELFEGDGHSEEGST
jgi:hypothetical protein